MSQSDKNIEQRLRQMFDDNLAKIQAEGMRTLSPDLMEFAFQQVLIYWRKLHDVAEKVTDTEVRLNLPEQTTPRGRKFGIEGVVDIVRENDQTIMYDIKTHDTQTVYANLSNYEKQLNVYAYIWQKLRGEPLDETAVICTAFPDSIRDALTQRLEEKLVAELAKWEPIVPISVDDEHVNRTIADFARIVDQIEDGQFTPAPLEMLKSKLPGSNSIFAVAVCRNCDARFSCSSYRTYAMQSRTSAERSFRAYLADTETDLEHEQRLAASLEIQPTLSPIDDLT